MASVQELAERLHDLATDVPTQTAGWIDGELEELLQKMFALLGEGHPLRTDVGQAVVHRQRQCQELRDSLNALVVELQGFARGLMA